MVLNCLLPASAVILSGLLVSLSNADVFLHNPRGSNNRLNGANANRGNNNRLFDSQNNAKGGYNVGDMSDQASNSEETQFNMHYFQSGNGHSRAFGLTGKSLLTIEWTNQHGCNDRDLNCNFVLQYRCQDDTKHETLNQHTIRNGKNPDTPQYTKKDYLTRANKNDQLNRDSVRFARGLHESWEWYDKCAKRKRVGGLFTADQNLNGQTTIYTRQNANGGRSGYECPEERDYYPYWHPTDWIDIAVFPHDASLCNYYRRESFNVKPKEECLQYYKSKTDGFRHDSSFSNKKECENNGGFWVSFSNFLEEYPEHQTEQACRDGSSRELPLIWAIPYRSEEIDNLKISGDNVESLKRCLVALAPPKCEKTPRTRTNHLGNSDGVVPVRYNWVIPYFPSGNTQRCVLRLRYNISTGDYPPFNTFSDKNDDPKNGVDSPVKNNPTVKVGKVKLPLQLAINTAQFGRTFQDRSHLFKLVSRSKHAVPDTNVIYNLNVRGKRGNIVQAYPAVEYDFVPKRLTIPSTSLVHIQWTGSNTNPQGNAGQGTAGTDRSNIVEMRNPSVNHPLTSDSPSTMFTNAQIIWSSDKDTRTSEDLLTSMASAGYYDSVSQFSTKKALDTLLNNAPASYRGMLLKFAPGEYYYMCSRNNNFSNRNQKGRLTVQNRPSRFRNRRFRSRNPPSRSRNRRFRFGNRRSRSRNPPSRSRNPPSRSRNRRFSFGNRRSRSRNPPSRSRNPRFRFGISVHRIHRLPHRFRTHRHRFRRFRIFG